MQNALSVFLQDKPKNHSFDVHIQPDDSEEIHFESDGEITLLDLFTQPVSNHIESVGETLIFEMFNREYEEVEFFKKECMNPIVKSSLASISIYINARVLQDRAENDIGAETFQENYEQCSFYAYENDKYKTTFTMERNDFDRLSNRLQETQDYLIAKEKLAKRYYEITR